MTEPQRFRPLDLVDAGRLLLRRPARHDVGAMYESVVASLGHLRPWMPWAVDGYTPAMAEAFVASTLGDVVSDAPYLLWAGGRLVGACGLHGRLGPGGLEIGYWVDVRHTRRGYASLAAAALTEVAFGLPGITTVEIHHDQANLASAAVPRRLGFVHVATSPNTPEAPGEVGVEWRWRMVKEDWPEAAGVALLA